MTSNRGCSRTRRRRRRALSVAAGRSRRRARLSRAVARRQFPGRWSTRSARSISVPAGDDAARATGTALVALALWGRGDLEAAHRTFSDALAIMRQQRARPRRHSRHLRARRHPRRRRAACATPRASMSRDCSLRRRGARPRPPETDELHLGLSELHREWNDIESAIGSLDAVTRSAAQTPHAGNKLRWCTAMASVRVARGDLDGALELLDEAERHERRDPLPRARPIPAMKARIRIAQGRLDEARRWVAACEAFRRRRSQLSCASSSISRSRAC